ncbi:MAG TPA: OmpA family protein [Pedobacter sp.]|uniref:OmpA family protein n=1 Tax=Pedobacter sp. TaxID=1411316 RepID=UPI002C768453|nr:OmpA family protein [Pedobacter sp.]HMI03431.1 OmpA family protein [Pedobacter sp.]
MTHRTILFLAMLAGAALLAPSCKTKKIPAKTQVPVMEESPKGDAELDKIKKEMPDDQVERTENGIKFTFNSEVLFPINSSYLSDPAKSKLDDVAKILKTKDSSRKILIDGHSDATGTANYNQWLSDKRAASVKVYLVTQGIDEQRIKTAGHGSTQPVASNKTPEGRLKNRRVEVTLLK